MTRQCIYYGWQFDLDAKNDKTVREWTDKYFSRPVDVDRFNIDHILAREQELDLPTYLRNKAAI